MLIDAFLPSFDVSERHEALIGAPREVVYSAFPKLDLSKSPATAVLFTIRRLPVLLTRSSLPARITIDAFLDAGFVVLDEEPGTEIVLGVVGRFWRPTSGIHPVTAAGFLGFDEPGFAKAAMNFHVRETKGRGTRAVTETRVACTDDATLRKFSLYWKVVGPFSSLIRKEMLRLLKREAEAVSTQVA